MHKLWEKLETAAFSPRLLRIAWPPGQRNSYRTYFQKGNPLRHPRGWALLLNVFSDAFSNVVFEPSETILEPLGAYFGSLWDLVWQLLAI